MSKYPVGYNAPHYKEVDGVTCHEAIEKLGLNFYMGNVLKYAWRYNFKGTPHQDLKKLIWYAERELARVDRTADEWAEAYEEYGDPKISRSVRTDNIEVAGEPNVS